MRGGVLLLAGVVALGGCSTEIDPCDGKPGVCLGLRVDSEVTPLDELVIHLGALDRERRTPSLPATLALPVRFAVLVDEAPPLDRRDVVDVEGRAAGIARARAQTTITVDDRGHAPPASLTLRAVEAPELGPDPLPDLADLAPPDLVPPPELTPVDFASSDLANLDMTPPVLYRLEVLKFELNGGGGAFDFSPPPFGWCGEGCRIYGAGTRVTITPRPAVGSRLVSFGRPCFGATTCEVMMDGDRALTASFTLATKPPNVMFATKAGFTLAELGANGANADGLCRTAATAAGLARPNDFVALLAHDSLTVAQLLGTARGWVRVDGLPFADDVTSLLSSSLYPPLTEDGTTPTIPYVTGYASSGMPGNICSGWSSSSASVDVGYASGGTKARLHAATLPSCTRAMGLYCFQRTSTTALTWGALAGGGASMRQAFISYGTVLGSAGIAAADALCMNESPAPTAGRTFRAYLVGDDAQSGRARFALTRGPWKRIVGDVVLSPSAATFDPLSIDSLLAPVERNAANAVVEQTGIWIGKQGASCWSMPAAASASLLISDSLPIAPNYQACGSAARVLCLED